VCCVARKEEYHRWWKRNGHKKEVKVWKVVVRQGQELRSEIRYYLWRPGIHGSGSRALHPKDRKRTTDDICLGFHVFKTKRDAIRYASVGQRIMAVRASPKDLLGVGANTMVFRTVTLTRQEHLEARSIGNEVTLKMKYGKQPKAL
jgi:hypothetical protein